MIYEEAVKNPNIKRVLFTAGGTGAGKVSAKTKVARPNIFKNLIKGAKYERMINPK